MGVILFGTLGNDGSGSGLDADTLDGQQGSYYAPIASPTFTGTVTYSLLNGPNTQSRDKIRVWNSSAYAIGMQNGYTFGALNDYAMSFQMSNTAARGFWWGDSSHTNAQGSMSLTTIGELTVAKSISIPGSETATSGSTGLYMYDDGSPHIHGDNNLWINSTTGAVYINNQNNGNVILTNGTGKVGIGTSSPTAELDIESTSPEIHLNDSDGVVGGAITSKVVFLASGSTHGNVGFGTGSGIMAVTNNQGNLYLQADVNNAQASSFINFTIDNSTKMRITNAGRVGIGTTAPATTLDVTNGTIRTQSSQGGYGNSAGNFHIDSKASTAGSVYLNWFSGTGGVRCGNGAAGYGIAYAAEFQAVSDRRLKENISYFDSGLAKILQLKPATFDFINGENNQKGFIAQDVEAVIPEVVRTTTMPDSNGSVDETDTYLTINSSAIIPYLVAAVQEQQGIIQEQQTIIDSFETRLAALEA